ncbi:MAG: phage portal protein [Pseudomonadota bacterium]
MAENVRDETVAEARSSIEDPETPITWNRLIEVVGLDLISAAGVNVTTDTAMGVPAIWSGVNFLSGTLASLPLNTYRRTREEPKRLRSRLANMLKYNVNEEMTSFAWRKYCFERVFTRGRSYTLIVRGEREPVRYLWPVQNDHMRVRRNGRGAKVYKIAKKDPHGGEYTAADVIDISFAMQENLVDHFSPIAHLKNTIGLAIAATEWGSKFFQNGGVPPFVITGKFSTPAGLNRASTDLREAIQQAAKERRLALALPDEHEIKPIGIDPEKSQFIALQRFLVEEIARIYSLPPVFLQDLSHGTFSNTEQQDLHFVKHTLTRWAQQVEQELNLKLYGWENHSRFCEFNLDGIQRGDFKTRMEGYALATQHALHTPNENRHMENLPPVAGGDQLHIQGATVPLGSQPTSDSPAAPGADPEDDENAET